jgi:hypothetical protein
MYVHPIAHPAKGIILSGKQLGVEQYYKNTKQTIAKI